jgi:hypothetical protein
MPYYTVEPGDTMVRIAHKFNFPLWQTIYDHADNAELKKKRPDPQVLYPGDRVFIPEPREKTVSVETGRTHVFRQPPLRAVLRIVVQDENGKPCANKPYILAIGDNAISGRTQGNGLVEFEVEPNPQDGELTVWPDGKGGRTLQFQLRLGDLNPLDTPSGVKARLRNLGFDPGSITGGIDDKTRDAIRTFQIVAGIPVTGELDEKTKAELEKAHDQKQ